MNFKLQTWKCTIEFKMKSTDKNPHYLTIYSIINILEEASKF